MKRYSEHIWESEDKAMIAALLAQFGKAPERL
jgi:hypothetical protein